MISNERQFRITKARAEEFDRALKSLAQNADHDSLWLKVQRDAIHGQLGDLHAELQEYESLKKRGPAAIEVSSFDELPSALVKARIAAGLTQRDLADRLDLKEQQIQRYEATNYTSASLERIQQVIHALGLSLGRGVFLPSSKVSLANLISRASHLGLPEQFLKKRLLSSKLQCESLSALTPGQKQTVALQLATRMERVFQVPSNTFFDDTPLTLPAGVLAGARFKVPKGADRRKVNAYAVYAHYLALLVLHCTQHLSARQIPTDPDRIYDDLMHKYGRVDFKACLSYVWDLGIPVLPLRESGGFHGACWRVAGRNVIVLKQAGGSIARWIVDLLHELKHASQHPNEPNFAWIETFDDNPDGDDEEIEATDFAVEVALAGRAEDIAQECARESKGRLQALKIVVPRVAKKHKVRVDVLANYLAHRLEAEDQNWWGTAQVLQETGPDPWSTTRDFLLSRIDFSHLNPLDYEVLAQALSE